MTVSLATGARGLRGVRSSSSASLRSRDLGNVEVLFTDKTGTLTEGHTAFSRAVDPAGKEEPGVLALAAHSADPGGNALDRALCEAPEVVAAKRGVGAPIAVAPFDHDRQLGSAIVDSPDGRLLVAKGAPEAILARCSCAPPEAAATLDALFAAGTRVVALATRPAGSLTSVTPADEHASSCAASFASPTRRRQTPRRRCRVSTSSVSS